MHILYHNNLCVNYLYHSSTNTSMKSFFFCLLLTTQFVTAQKLKKADKAAIINLQTHINYLADDKLEGRRTGSNGEKLAYEYISNEFLKAGLAGAR